MSMQPIFLFPLSTTVWGEIDEQIRSWAALKKETFTRIFIRLIPPSFPTKCFLYCSKICSLLMPSLSPSTLVMVASHLVCFGLRKTRLRCSLDPPRMIVLFRISVTTSFTGTFLFVTPSFSTSSSDVVLITDTSTLNINHNVPSNHDSVNIHTRNMLLQYLLNSNHTRGTVPHTVPEYYWYRTATPLVSC